MTGVSKMLNKWVITNVEFYQSIGSLVKSKIIVEEMDTKQASLFSFLNMEKYFPSEYNRHFKDYSFLRPTQTKPQDSMKSLIFERQVKFYKLAHSDHKGKINSLCGVVI